MRALRLFSWPQEPSSDAWVDEPSVSDEAGELEATMEDKPTEEETKHDGSAGGSGVVRLRSVIKRAGNVLPFFRARPENNAVRGLVVDGKVIR